MARGDEVMAYLLDRCMYASKVQDLAADLGISSSGPKAEVIERILDEGRPQPVEVLSYVTVEGLRYCCEEFGLDARGTRDILVDRISSFVQRSWAAGRRRSTGRRVEAPAKPLRDVGQPPIRATALGATAPVVVHDAGSRSYSAALSVIAIIAEALGIYFYGSYGVIGLVFATLITVISVYAAFRLWPRYVSAAADSGP